MITCWERADLLALLCVMFSCVFVTIPHGVSDQVLYLIVSIPDLCLLYFKRVKIRAVHTCKYLLSWEQAGGLDYNRVQTGQFSS